MTEDALADWRALAGSKLFGDYVAAGKLVATELVGDADPAASLRDGHAAVLRHERIPFVSYPYEWPFGMLKDAALLELELLEAALAEDLLVKDATPYNVQWRGARPVFIDVGSFEPLRPGEPWAGYRQFCTLFLNPLLLQALKDVPYQPWLRGSLEGITPLQLKNLLGVRDLFRRGVFTHVYLHSRLERRYGDRRRDVRSELRAAGFRKELIAANARRLAKVVRGLEWTPAGSEWSEYRTTSTYTDEDAAQKAEFVRAAAASAGARLVWDLGCNDGSYSRIAAEHADYVVALDADQAVVERLYRELRAAGETRILPLVADLADPSPNLGWRGRERTALAERGRPQLMLALAVLHHLAITRNVPVEEFLGWVRSLGSSLVIEFVDRGDPMAERLLAAKRTGLHDDWRRDVFEQRLGEAFDVERSVALASGTRFLYYARPRS